MARLLYFGRLSDLTGADSETISLPAAIRDGHSLRRWLDEHKALDGALLERSIRLAVNNEIVADSHPLHDTDEIAFMPPVGGG